MKIQAICIGAPGLLDGKRAKTGIFKHPVSASVIVDAAGIAGDAVLNRKHHGGLDQAVLVYGSNTLDWWSDELATSLEPGTFGENLIIEGMENSDIAAGDRFTCADLVLEATSPRMPCSTLALRMRDKNFVKRYLQAGRPGIYCRVLRPGVLKAGADVRFERFSGNRITLAEMMAHAGRRLSPEEKERYLAAPIHHKLRDLILSQ
jgi:MOSC domain-containing protein YiiM